MKQSDRHNLNDNSDWARAAQKRSSLFFVIVIPFLLQIAAAIGLTGWLSIRSGQKAIEELATQLMGEVGYRIQENLRTKLETPHLINQLNANLIDLGLLPVDNQLMMGKHFFRQIQEFDDIVYIYIGNPKGGAISVGQSGEDNQLHFHLTPGFVKNEVLRYNTDTSGNPTTLVKSLGPYNATIRPWYTGAIEAGKPIWSDIYRDIVTNKPVSTAALPIYDNKGNILGVLGADILLFEEFNQLLGSLKISQSGEVFIMQRTGELLSSSLTEFSSISEDDDTILPQAADSYSPFIRAALQQAQANITDFKYIEDVRNFSFVLDGEKQFAQVIPFQDERGIDWFIFIAVPESDFMAEIDAQRATTILLCLLALIVAGGGGILTASWVIQPLLTLNLAARDLASGQWDRTVSTNRNDEVGELAVAFNSMAKQLKSSFETLEQRVRDRTTELAQSNQKLADEKERADLANQAKSAFIANMSHELRSPLNAILGFTQVMTRSQTLPSEHQESVGIINRSGEHLLTLINNVLDLSKIEAGRITLNEKNFDLHRLLDDIHDMFQLKAADKGLQLLLETGPSVPRYIHTDEVKLRQILINLINNALKFTEQGGICIRSQCLEPSKIVFEVEDTGPGIAPEDLDKLFEAFSQTESGKKAQEGTGLGLSISRKFVQLMGGEMKVSSQVGRGTIFSFSINVNEVEAGEIESQQVNKRRIIALEPNQPRYRILIVDDKPVNRQLLVRLLSPFGFELLEASNGREAVDNWEQWQPHLIWMDMRMPVMDGFEATQTIKTTTAGQATAIVAVTASVLEEERAVVVSAGCDDFLRKPFREEDIFNLMEKHLGLRYVYEDLTPTDVETGQEADALTSENFRALSPQLLVKLRGAVISGSKRQQAAAIEAIGAENTALAEAIQESLYNFEYDKILNLISMEDS